MFGLGWVELVIIAVVILVLFGRGKISSMMGELGRGITSFKKGMKEEDAAPKEKVKDTSGKDASDS